MIRFVVVSFVFVFVLVFVLLLLLLLRAEAPPLCNITDLNWKAPYHIPLDKKPS